MKTLLILPILFFTSTAYTQDFVTRAKIEFEKKESMRNNPQQVRDLYGESRISYFDLMFSDNRSLYKSGRDNEAPPLPGSRNLVIFGNKNTNALYFNFNTGQMVTKKNILFDDYIIEDSIPPIKWKIGQETRKIAGYECRKAIGRIYDSVYLVAFYAEELVLRGGPEGIQGLPGMILGLAIPRYNTTWFATKVELANIDESMIVAPALKGKKLSRDETRAKLLKKLEQIGYKDASKFVDGYYKNGYLL